MNHLCETYMIEPFRSVGRGDDARSVESTEHLLSDLLSKRVLGGQLFDQIRYLSNLKSNTHHFYI